MRLFAATAALVFFASASAFARDPVAAEALFRAGRDATTRGDHATACAKFAESQRLDPAPGTLLNLGACKEGLGLFASAWQHYREAADRLSGDPRRAQALQKASDIEPRLSRLTLELAPGAPLDTTVTRDGEVLGSAAFGVPLPLDAGAHVVVVTSMGRAPKRIAIELAVAENRTLAIAPGPPAASPDRDAPGGAAGSSESGATRTAGFVLGGVGAASLAVGSVTGIMTIQRKATVDDHCRAQVCDSAGSLAASQGKVLSMVSTVTFLAGLAGLGAGVVLVVTGRPRSTAATVVEPSIGPGIAALRIAGAF